MKALGIIRSIDDLGRIVVPKEVRDSQGWYKGQKMELFMSTEGLVIAPYKGEEERENALEILKRTKKYITSTLDKELLQELNEVIAYLERK